MLLIIEDIDHRK